ncbi:MAG TPA: DUF5134 domain-containing protein [Streptosporangiaceae bacterium]|nr:DUF5134 domain-containing protein [Streptosporangiaceae bacterium]
MAGPAGLAETFAGFMIVTAVYCASRLVIARTQRRPTEHDVDLVHVVMGVAMAGMLVPRIGPLWRGSPWSGAWALVFGASTAWFAWRTVQAYRCTGRLGPAGRHHLPHLIMCGAMVYMLLATSGPGPGGALAMAAPAPSVARFPLLGLILAQFMAGYAIWTLDRLPALARVRAVVSAGSPAGGPAGGPPLSQRLAACCNIAMGIVMGYMLVTML